MTQLLPLALLGEDRSHYALIVLLIAIVFAQRFVTASQQPHKLRIWALAIFLLAALIAWLRFRYLILGI